MEILRFIGYGIVISGSIYKSEYNADENDNIDVYDAADGTSGKQGFSSSFSNSSNSVLINEANDSERLKENEEKKEPPTEE